MIEPKFPFRQFFDFRFGVNASRFFISPTLSVADREHKSPGPKTSGFPDQIN